MKAEQFNEIFERRQNLSNETLVKKAEEYATDHDRLHNFKRAGEMAECSAIKALAGMKLKHDVSVADMIDDAERGVMPSRELLDEKIGDSINYLHLLEALFVEQIEVGLNDHSVEYVQNDAPKEPTTIGEWLATLPPEVYAMLPEVGTCGRANENQECSSLDSAIMNGFTWAKTNFGEYWYNMHAWARGSGKLPELPTVKTIPKKIERENALLF